MDVRAGAPAAGARSTRPAAPCSRSREPKVRPRLRPGLRLNGVRADLLTSSQLRHPVEVQHAGRKPRPADLWPGPEPRLWVDGRCIWCPLPGPRPREAVFPRRPTSRLVRSGRRTWAREQGRRAVRHAHAVRGHLRALWGGQGKASEQARAFASQHRPGPSGQTFVRSHVRGRRAGGEEPVPEPVRVDARGLATVAALSGGFTFCGHS